MSKRDSFIFYRSFFDGTKPLKKNEKAELFDAICNYALDQIEPNLKPLSNAMFALIRPQLDANYKRFLNGKKPKEKTSKTEANNKQTVSKTEANKNVNVNDNLNANVNDNSKELRAKAFAESIKEFKDYDSKMLEKFISYWTESGENQKKLRFEFEKVFDKAKRLKTWSNNQRPEKDEDPTGRRQTKDITNFEYE